MAKEFDPYHQWLGIRPGERPVNHYRLLGLGLFESDPDVIAHAVDQRMAHVRSLQAGPRAALSQKILNELAAARICLLNAEKKAAYDRRLQAEREASGASESSAPARPPGTPPKLPVAQALAAKPSPAAAMTPVEALPTALPVNPPQQPAGNKQWQVICLSAGFGACAVLLVVAAILVVTSQSRRPVADSTGAPETPEAPRDEALSIAPRAPAAESSEAADSPREPSGGASAAADRPADAPVRPGVERQPSAPPWRQVRQPVRPAEEVPAREEPDHEESPTGPGGPASAPSGPMELSDLVVRIEPSVVRIDVDDGVGSGFVVDPGGRIVTNYHVIEGASSAKVTFHDGSSLNVEGYLAVDPGRDLALLSVRPKGELAALPLATELPRKGAKVAAFGAPKGLSFSTTDGIVSAIRTGADITGVGKNLLGQEIYRRILGYSQDATWIQTSAPISGGNSGGPLVDMRGRVVGINTLSRADAQNLNFAIAAPDIARLVNGAGSDVRRIASLPRHTRPGRTRPGGTRPPTPGARDLQIRFPSGGVVTSATFSTDPVELQRWLRETLRKDEGSVATLEYPGGSLRALACHKRGILDGTSFGVYEDKNPKLYATYEEGDRHGVLKAWDTEGKKLLWCQYDNGKRHGFCCLFKDDDLHLVLECKHDKTTAVHLVAAGQLAKSFADEHEARQDATAAAALNELAELDKTLLVDERAFKKEVREAEEAHRREMVSALNPKKRAAIQRRASQRRSESNALMNSLRRRSGVW